MTRSKVFVRGLLIAFLLAGLLAGALAPRVMSARAAPQKQNANHVVISEFRTRGPAGENDEFIELYNPTSSNVDISGWEIWGSNSSGSTSRRAVIPSISPLQPGQHYLIANTGSNGYIGSYDFSYSVEITDDGGIALIRPDIPIPTIIDQVGMSAGSAYKEPSDGSGILFPLSGSSGQSYERKVGGAGGNCYDTDNNQNDFFLQSAPNPQISSDPPVTNCGYPPLAIVISEVAWAGTLASPDDEWIELYNPGSSAVNLNGWRLIADSGHIDIALSGTISIVDQPNPRKGYFLLERAHDNTVSDVTANQIYFGAFSDSGEILRLRAPDGTIVDTANSNGGAWPAGCPPSADSTYPDCDTAVEFTGSMERMGVIADEPSAWVTNVNQPSWTKHDAANNFVHGTPEGHNWGFDVTYTPTPTVTPSLTPTLTSTPAASRDVLINEIGWMGTLASSNDEWIELYNPGSQDINLSGWKLNATDGSPAINLASTISAGGYFVLATSSGVFDDLTPQQTFSGSLNNAGEVLRLYDSTGQLIDTANSDGGSWPAGVASPAYASMERRGVTADVLTSWSTYADPNPTIIVHDHDGNAVKGTPGRSNWGLTVTLTPSPTPTSTRLPYKSPTPRPPTPFGHVVVNEFLPRAGFDWNNDGAVNVYDEFIEIENLGPIDADLKNWKLDDELNLGSSPYTLPSMKLKPGERTVFYGSTTHILLDDSGDTVRLINPSGVVIDARGYGPVKYPDQSHCRIPDGAGYWRNPCFPTPGTANALIGSVPASSPNTEKHPPVCLFADTVPDAFRQAECNAFGADMWNRSYWDDQAGQSQFPVPDAFSKWQTLVE